MMMKQSFKWRIALAAAALTLVLCASGGVADGAGHAGVVGDCFPDEPVLTPDLPEYHCREGGARYGQRQYDLAIESYLKALEIDPEYENAYYGMAFTYRAMGRLDLAIENYSEVIRLAPDYEQPYASRAELYQCVGRYEDAEKDLDSFVRLYGQYPVPYLARGDFLMERGEYFRAAEDYAAAIERNPNLREARLKYASALLLSGKPEEASAAFAQAAALAK
jgi:tetratricopeptide (TPR) repeat protein